MILYQSLCLSISIKTDLPDADNNTFYVGMNKIAWVRGRDGSWTFFGVCEWKELSMRNLPFFSNFVNLTETAEKRNCS